MKEGELEKLGLTKNEAKTYLALLEAGLTGITNLVRKTALHKQIIYDNLERLIAKGLVCYVIKMNKKYFSATSPEKLIDALKEQKQEMDKKEKIAKKLLPQLIALKGKAKETQLASIYCGKDGIKAILESILKQENEIFIYGAEGKFKETLGVYWANFNKRREKLKIKSRIIYNEKLRGKREKLKFVCIKYAPKEFESPATTWVFDDKVAIILWTGTPVAVLVENKEINKSYRNYFELIWKIAQK